MLTFIKAFIKDEKGQALTEYGLIIALIAVVLIGALGFLSGALEGVFNSITTELGGTTS